MDVETEFDALIVGGGAAGLGAALELVAAGASVAVVDENAQLGGQYFRRRPPSVVARHGDHRPEGTRLVQAVRRAGVKCFTETLVWGAEGRTLWTSNAHGQMEVLIGRTLLLATGAYERSIPFPGWTLPGVCTPGLASHMASVDVVPVGRQVIVAGSGPFLLSAACALIESGTRVTAVVEYHSPYRLAPHATPALRHPGRLLELARYFRTLLRHGVRLYQGAYIGAALASGGRLTSVTIEEVGNLQRRRVLPADCLCIGYGFVANTELARILGCSCVPDPHTGDLIVESDSVGATSIPGVFVAGELRGIAGASAAIVRGRLAAHGMSSALGRQPPLASTAHLVRTARRLNEFADVMARMFPIPAELYRRIPDDTVACRCEHITAGCIRESVRLGWNDTNSVKGATRAGMGLCQGRICGPAVRAIVGREGLRGKVSGLQGFSARIPIRPIRFPVASGADDAAHR